MEATSPGSPDAPHVGAVDRNVLRGPASVWMRYCGVCVTRLYWTPFFGFSQKARRGLQAAAQRDQQAVGDVALRETALGGLGAIHFDVELGLIERPAGCAGPPSPGRGCNCGSMPVHELRGWLSTFGPTTWMSIGAGKPKFRIWLTMSAGRKANITPGNSRGQIAPQRADVIGRRAMILLQADQDVRVRRCRSAPSCCRSG